MGRLLSAMSRYAGEIEASQLEHALKKCAVFLLLVVFTNRSVFRDIEHSTRPELENPDWEAILKVCDTINDYRPHAYVVVVAIKL